MTACMFNENVSRAHITGSIAQVEVSEHSSRCKLPRTVHEGFLLEPQMLHGLRRAFHSMLLLCWPTLTVMPRMVVLFLRQCMLAGVAPIGNPVQCIAGALGQVQCPRVPAHCRRRGALRGIDLQQRLQQHLRASAHAVKRKQRRSRNSAAVRQ